MLLDRGQDVGGSTGALQASQRLDNLFSHMICLLFRASLRLNGKGNPCGTQTERRGGAGPVRGLLGGKNLTGRFVSSFHR